jgi:hypothetical protein
MPKAGVLFSVVRALLCLCSCGAFAQPLDLINLPPGYSVNVFTNSTPYARSLAASQGNQSIIYVSNNQAVRKLASLSLPCSVFYKNTRTNAAHGLTVWGTPDHAIINV